MANRPNALCVAVAALFCMTGTTIADATLLPAMPFVDGLWRGDITTGPNGTDFEACWASTTFDDGTTFTLAERKDGRWTLELSNPKWSLPPSRRYDIDTLVDFYPRLHITGKASSQTILEISDLEHISLLHLIENGHTIDLSSDGFNEKYVLEGSAKIIARIRSCFADRPSA